MLTAVLMHTAFAAMVPPDAMVETTTQDVLKVIKTTADQRKLVRIAEAKVVQNFDFERMTRLAVGKSWRMATPEQQRVLSDQFKDLLVRTYSNALANGAHNNATLKMMPFHMHPGDVEVTVATQITESGREPIEIDYRLENEPTGWKVYDVIVDNVSLVMNYRSSFNAQVNKSGIEGLITRLKEKNMTLTSH